MNRPKSGGFFVLFFMKYRQLTKQQFETLHQEFAQFLATQQIDVKEWEKIKKENETLMLEELNMFSDIVWEDILTKATYLEHISEHELNLFFCDKDFIERIYVKLNKPLLNFLKDTDFNWFLENPLHETIEYFKGKKNYVTERNLEIFDLIKMGATLSKGNLFNFLKQLIS